MNTTFKPALWTGMGLLSLAAIFSGNNANAYERGYERPVYVEPIRTGPVIERHWVEGHYETKCETVLVAPEYKEIRVTPPVLETRSDYFGKPYTVMITPEHHEEICIPAKYEKVDKQVWIPGFYKEVTVQAPPPPAYTTAPAPAVVLHASGEKKHHNFFDVFFRM